MADKQAMCIAAFRKSHGTQHSLINMPEKWKGQLIGETASQHCLDTNHNLLYVKLKI